jgi:ABC-type nickel/cobalt efflux system permease component RcnA
MHSSPLAITFVAFRRVAQQGVVVGVFSISGAHKTWADNFAIAAEVTETRPGFVRLTSIPPKLVPVRLKNVRDTAVIGIVAFKQYKQLVAIEEKDMHQVAHTHKHTHSRTHPCARTHAHSLICTHTRMRTTQPLSHKTHTHDTRRYRLWWTASETRASRL